MKKSTYIDAGSFVRIYDDTPFWYEYIDESTNEIKRHNARSRGHQTGVVYEIKGNQAYVVCQLSNDHGWFNISGLQENWSIDDAIMELEVDCASHADIALDRLQRMKDFGANDNTDTCNRKYIFDFK